MIETRRRHLRGLLAAALSLGTAPGLSSQDAPRIGAAELKALLDKGGAVVIDVRDRGAYAGGHLEGARSLPLAELGSRLSELPKDKHIVAYCT